MRLNAVVAIGNQIFNIGCCKLTIRESALMCAIRLPHINILTFHTILLFTITILMVILWLLYDV